MCACTFTPPLNSSVPWQSSSLWTSARGQWETDFATPFMDDYWQETSGETGASWGSILDSPVSHWLGLLLFLLCPHLLLIMLTGLPNYPLLFLSYTSNPPPSPIIWKCSSSPPTFLLHLKSMNGNAWTSQWKDFKKSAGAKKNETIPYQTTYTQQMSQKQLCCFKLKKPKIFEMDPLLGIITGHGK